MRLVRLNILLVSIAVILGGCSQSDTTQNPPKPPVVLPAGSYNFQLKVKNLREIDTTVSRYVLWLAMSDTTWQAVPLNFWYTKRLPDSMVFHGVVKVKPDSILRSVLSIERLPTPSKPTVTLIAGDFSHGTLSAANMSTADTAGMGDFSSATGSVLFTTQSTDTNRAKQEFYLMQVANGVRTASVSGLPKPKSGWVYGLWVLDSGFYPQHKFFYGAFADVGGPDSDPTNDGFPFPGGYNPAPLNDPGARLEVTLEPAFAVQGNHPSAPSPIIIFWVPLSRFIDYNQTMKLNNVWSGSAPSGVLTLTN